jgi:glycosyltransferase involved in cell wall biosynthesis
MCRRIHLLALQRKKDSDDKKYFRFQSFRDPQGYAACSILFLFAHRCMKIIIIGTAYPLRGGIAHYNALLYQELSKKHNVDIITFKRQYPSLLFPGKTQKETGGEMLRVPSEALIDSINPMNWPVVANEIRKRKPDLLIMKYWLPFFGPCFGRIARVAKTATNTRVLYICDNVVPHEKRPGDTMFTRYAFNAGDYFIVQSDSVELDLRSFMPQAKYKKVAHPVYNIFGERIEKTHARKQLAIGNERVLLCFGYVRAYKGLNVMLEAMAKLKDFNTTLYVVGEFYDDKEKYMKLIAEYGLQNHVVVNSDYVANDKVGLYFSAADVAMLPYISATQSGIAQIAYNFNKPVIATNVGGLGEVVRNNVTGFVVEPNNADAIANAVRRYFNEHREQEFTANVELEKKKYSWEAMTNAIEEFMS